MEKQAGRAKNYGGEKWTLSCFSAELAATNVLHGQIAEDSFPIYILITPSNPSNGSLLLFKMRERAASQSNKGELKLITQMCSELRGRQIYPPKEERVSGLIENKDTSLHLKRGGRIIAVFVMMSN